MKAANISEIDPGVLWVGGDLSPVISELVDQREYIIHHGIKTIIDLRAEMAGMTDEHIWFGSGVDYVHIGAEDYEGYHMGHEIFEEVVLAFKNAMRYQRLPVLVHCHMGVNRAPSAAYAILLEQGMTHRDAYEKIVIRREQAGLAYAGCALASYWKRHMSHPLTEEDIEVAHRNADKHKAEFMTPTRISRIEHRIRNLHEQDRRNAHLIGQDRYYLMHQELRRRQTMMSREW